MRKTLELIELYATYSGLLTARQKEIGDMYFIDDYLMEEIAEELKISKISISDTIKNIISKIRKMEKQLNIYKKNNMLKDLVKRLNRLTMKEVIESIEEVIKYGI